MSDAIREAFEKWYISEYGTLGDGVKFHGKFGYPDIVVDTAWKSWQAALQSQTAPAPPSVAVPEGFDVRRNSEGDIIVTRLSDGGAAAYSKDSPMVTVVMGWHFLDAMLTAAPQPEPLRFSDTAEEIEERLAYLDENACPHCGGSGHKDDAAQPDHSPDAGKVVQGESVAYDQHERECGNLIDERDHAENWADKLAGAIGEYFGIDIGEHSNCNCPWETAFDNMPDTHPAESREVIQAQALDAFIGVVNSSFRTEAARLRASQQEGNTAGDDGEEEPHG